jgi:SAM-dependent methyltransferase
MAHTKRPTFNETGYMSNFHTPALDKYLDQVEHTHGQFADIGPAFGYTTLEALKRGGHITAIDLDAGHLTIIEQECPPALKAGLKTQAGHFPSTIQLEDSYYDGVLMSKVLLFYKSFEIDDVLAHIYRSLKSGGYFYVISPSPLRESLSVYRPLYEKQKRAGDLWPGHVDDYTTQFPKHKGILPDALQFIDQESLTCGLELAGFKVVECDYAPKSDEEGHEANDVVYAIAQKL